MGFRALSTQTHRRRRRDVVHLWIRPRTGCRIRCKRFSLESAKRPDRRSRISLFAGNLGLAEGDSSLLAAAAEDSQGRKYSSVLEYVGPLNQAPGIIQIILKIPDELAHIGDVMVKVARSTSNKVHVMLAKPLNSRIKPWNYFPTD